MYWHTKQGYETNMGGHHNTLINIIKISFSQMKSFQLKLQGLKSKKLFLISMVCLIIGAFYIFDKRNLYVGVFLLSLTCGYFADFFAENIQSKWIRKTLKIVSIAIPLSTLVFIFVINKM